MTTEAERIRICDWDAALDDSNYYELLGVLPIADDQAIRDAFRAFSLAFHPDVHRGAEDELVDRVRRIFQRGAEAYRVLSDAQLRLRYDMALERGELRLDARSVPRVPSIAPPARPLPDLCRTAGAKASAKKAARMIDEGDLAGAKAELDAAVRFDGGASKELRERIDALEVALFAMGG